MKQKRLTQEQLRQRQLAIMKLMREKGVGVITAARLVDKVLNLRQQGAL